MNKTDTIKALTNYLPSSMKLDNFWTDFMEVIGDEIFEIEQKILKLKNINDIDNTHDIDNLIDNYADYIPLNMKWDNLKKQFMYYIKQRLIYKSTKLSFDDVFKLCKLNGAVYNSKYNTSTESISKIKDSLTTLYENYTSTDNSIYNDTKLIPKYISNNDVNLDNNYTLDDGYYLDDSLVLNNKSNDTFIKAAFFEILPNFNSNDYFHEFYSDDKGLTFDDKLPIISDKNITDSTCPMGKDFYCFKVYVDDEEIKPTSYDSYNKIYYFETDNYYGKLDNKKHKISFKFYTENESRTLKLKTLLTPLMNYRYYNSNTNMFCSFDNINNLLKYNTPVNLALFKGLQINMFVGKTKYGYLYNDDLNIFLFKSSVLKINSLPSYCTAYAMTSPDSYSKIYSESEYINTTKSIKNNFSRKLTTKFINDNKSVTGYIVYHDSFEPYSYNFYESDGYVIGEMMFLNKFAKHYLFLNDFSLFDSDDNLLCKFTTYPEIIVPPLSHLSITFKIALNE